MSIIEGDGWCGRVRALSIVVPLARHYTHWVLDNLAEKTKKDTPNRDDETLSRTEQTRLIRILYRFQLYCNLFGAYYYPWGIQGGSIQGGISTRMKKYSKKFLFTYETWAIESFPASTHSQSRCMANFLTNFAGIGIPMDDRGLSGHSV